MKMQKVECRPIRDSRGLPTLETTLSAEGHSASASVPSGKSTGSHEAKELRDPDKGVTTAINHVLSEISELLCSRDFASADDLDSALLALDGTQDKSRLGANAILSVSIAAQRLFALAEQKPLWKAITERGGFTPGAPQLFVNVLNGGAHADFRLPFQEYMLVVGGTPSEAYATIERAFADLKTQLPDTPMGDEGGFSPVYKEIEKPFDLIKPLAAKYPSVTLSIDAAASELWHDDHYELVGKHYSPDELRMLYAALSHKYQLHSIEDAFFEDAHEDFAKLTAQIGTQTIIIGDDLTTTNPAMIDRCIERKEINGVLIKPNQIGTVKEAIEAVQKTHAAGWKTVCSHRSGETLDTFIADFAYGVGAHGLKAGGLGQQERIVKYQRLIEIEGEAH